MLKFKDAIRHSWNMYFANTPNPMSPEIQEAFSSVEIGLFKSIVLAPFDAFDKAKEYRQHPLPFIIVKPAKGLSELPLQIGEIDNNGNTVWKLPTSIKVHAATHFEFYDYFDWYPYGFIDLPYVRARFRDVSANGDLQGKIALIEQSLCQFFFAS